jgi:hypothetical protein
LFGRLLIKIGSQQWVLFFVRILASEIYAVTLDFADSMICGIGEYGVQRQFPCVLTSEYDPGPKWRMSLQIKKDASDRCALVRR